MEIARSWFYRVVLLLLVFPALEIATLIAEPVQVTDDTRALPVDRDFAKRSAGKPEPATSLLTEAAWATCDCLEAVFFFDQLDTSETLSFEVLSRFPQTWVQTHCVQLQ